MKMPQTLSEAAMPDPIESARQAGLRYLTDEAPGIQRVKRGKAFSYVGLDGKPIRDEEQLLRIRRLAIPPAWTSVWISPAANSHLQATGVDARGRKQYRYHPEWRSVRDQTKFSRMMAFGRALPGIRKRVTKDLELPGLPRNRVLALVVRLLETTLIRVGNDEYARNNRSYGLTTMRDKHAKVCGDTVSFQFRGKSGKQHSIDVSDRQLARLVRKCQELPDQEIFAYIDDHGDWQDVKSQDVNAYLREITGEEFTAKDFRTWAGTVLAAIALKEFEEFASSREAKKNIVQAIESVAKMLGNTPSICRKCYVHPAVLDSYLDGVTIATIEQESREALKRKLHTLKPEEAAVMALLEDHFAAASKQRKGARAKDLVSPATGRESKARTPARDAHRGAGVKSAQRSASSSKRASSKTRR